MAITEPKNTSESDNINKDKLRDNKKERPLTKIVVRRLPPAMDLECFLNQVSPIPDYDYIYLVKGDMSLGENAFSRVYINFTNPSDIFIFKEKFDNYVFVNQKGHEYLAVVEFASFQKIPRKRKPRVDPKSGTIESDPYYLEFVESLKQQPQNDEKPEFSYQFSNEKNDVISTPLLDYIKQRRLDKQRIREERRDERKRRELERKKFREEERKRMEHKTPVKSYKGSSTSRVTKVEFNDSIKEESNENAESKSDETKEITPDKKESAVSHKEQKYEEKSHFKPKSRFSHSDRMEYAEKKFEHKNRREEYKEKEYRSRRFEEYKKNYDTPRKTKKYSEKREERKNEAKRAEQKRLEETLDTSTNNSDNVKETGENKADEKNEKSIGATKDNGQKTQSDKYISQYKSDEPISDVKESRLEAKNRNKPKDHDPRLQRRIKNKDRPTMAIYQPGMLSKRRTTEVSDNDTVKD